MNEAVPLLIFAHKAEAQRFLVALKGKVVPPPSPLAALLPEGALYELTAYSPPHPLLLCGERREELYLRLSAYFAAAQQPISQIINLGVAGQLRGNFTPLKTYRIKTAYGFEADAPQLESFTSNADQPEEGEEWRDCLTIPKEKVGQLQSAELSPFAELVDCELWHIAKLAKRLRLPFSALKVVSDDAAAISLAKIKAESATYSQALLNAYLEHALPHHRSVVVKKNSPYPALISLQEKAAACFQLTYAQEKQLKKQLKAWQRKQLPLKQLKNLLRHTQEDGSKKKLTAKQQFALFRQAIRTHTEPRLVRLETALQQESKALSSAEVKVEIPSLESGRVKIILTAEAEAELKAAQQQLGEHLQCGAFSRLFQLLNGGAQ